jgi:hypothetical protein
MTEPDKATIFGGALLGFFLIATFAVLVANVG